MIAQVEMKNDDQDILGQLKTEDDVMSLEDDMDL